MQKWQERTKGWLHDENNIRGFFGYYRWLSNFHPCVLVVEGIMYPSSEHAYQASKSLDNEVRKWFQKMTPYEAKRKGRIIQIRPYWEDIKLQVMEGVVMAKFAQNQGLYEALKTTGEKYLEETNWWNDRFWGVCNYEGENHLGKILMKVRETI